jgi:spore coat polysaccharide biosynthesis protein SpsF
LCAGLGIDCFRGSEDDVLDRYYKAAHVYQIGQVVRLTADCPLLDPQVVDEVVGVFQGSAYAYVSNINPPTYPDGLDTEVFSWAALATAWQQARLRSEREHVTLYIRNHPETFHLGNVTHQPDLSELRWVVDERRDLAFIRAIYDHLGERPFGLDDVLQVLRQHAELQELNANILRNEGLLKSLAEDKVI